MFELIKKTLGFGGHGAAGAPAGEQGMKIEVAACALLLEAAYADYKCTDEELEHVVATMREIFDISEEYADELMELAHKEREHAVDVFVFAREMNEKFKVEEKLQVLEALWKVIYSDGVIDKHESALAGKLVQLLRLDRKEAYEAKLSAKKWAQK